MPKWGLSMTEGKMTGWLVGPGTRIRAGDEIMEVETEKIANVVEAADSGTLRRVIAEPDTVYPVKALLGVLADDDVPEAEIDAYVAGYVTPAAGESEADAAPQHQFIDTASGRLRYARHGDGKETLVLIHGFGGDLDTWLFNSEVLAEDATVYALDLPGHGQSSKALRDPTLAGLSRALVEFMDGVGIGPAHLAGHSMGGAVSMRTALDHPGRVKSLSLVASAGLGPEIDASYIAGFIASNSRRELKPLLERLFADKSLVNRDLIDLVLKYKRLDGVREALTALMGHLFSGGQQADILAEATAASGVPTLVVFGDRDEIIPASHVGAVRGARAETIAGVGHMAQMEAQNAVNALIRQQLASAA
jgi:pyruvate dehydrogenase E2 component (dihydrolipoamide acetyltransferase)